MRLSACRHAVLPVIRREGSALRDTDPQVGLNKRARGPTEDNSTAPNMNANIGSDANTQGVTSSEFEKPDFAVSTTRETAPTVFASDITPASLEFEAIPAQEEGLLA
jgi:hypothetical protein